MDDKKVAFIICVNDEIEFSECMFYLERLEVPDGMDTDIICVREAESMAAGYNAAMDSTDAKYKVYMHQDTFILNNNFLKDMIWGFQEHSEVGIMGVVGVENCIDRGNVISLYDTGKVLHNLVPGYLDYDLKKGNLSVDTNLQAYVNALDGLILMTQYDVRWRDDLFDGWDFYDASQCMEFFRAGYKAAVVKQQRPWVLHDCTASKYKNYMKYQQRYIQEYYPSMFHDLSEDNVDAVNKFDEKISLAKEVIVGYIEAGEREMLHKFFADETHRGYVRLRELELISRIDAEEHEAGILPTVWFELVESYEMVLHRLRLLKFTLWRIEFGVDDTEETKNILADFSDIAKRIVRETYVYI